MATAKSVVPRRQGKEIVLSRTAAVVYVGIVLGLILILWSTRRERESHVRVPDIERFEETLPSIAGLTGSPIQAGNRVEVLQNGDQFFPALLRDIAAAKETIHIETYVWWKGEICGQVARALADKARQKVEVRLTLDAVGSNKGDDELFEMMEKAGVRIALFHPFRIQDIGLFNNRTHRKLAIFDGRIGYVFGHGMAEEWTGHGQDEKHWRDTGVRIEGPVVNSIQAVFAENWVEQTSEVIVGEKYFPRLPAVGNVRAHMTASSPQGGVSRLEMLFKLAISAARRELIVQNPYFIPDGEIVGLLTRAAKRGVKVRIMLPGAVTDSSVVRHAGHRRFEELLEQGIEICEYKKTLNHQKIMIVDGLWSFVGSTNFDDRSLDINDEASIGLIDPGVADELKTAFEQDQADCPPINLEQWRKRSVWDRFADRASYMINEQL
ncbi:MAG TPA: phospholipase D-like domain-containing protein [Thermoanaerobaculia bacterium]|jgi:cardiolipin synthase|nr:phospholipase D-like domain-containing protein [Thermoanaerobaculia bacterium]